MRNCAIILLFAVSFCSANELVVKAPSDTLYVFTPEQDGGVFPFTCRIEDGAGNPIIVENASVSVMSGTGYYYTACEEELTFYNPIDGPDAYGWFFFEVPILPGGVDVDATPVPSFYIAARVYYQDSQAYEQTAVYLQSDIYMVSPDFNGDGVVNLSDIIRFTTLDDNPDWRIDFNQDGDFNLSDIVFFTGSIGLYCEN